MFFDPLRSRPVAPIFALLFSIATAACPFVSRSGAATTPEPAEIPVLLDQLGNTGRVLYVAAHPDDENTQLIAYLSRVRGYRTAYLAMTRGDGGQNVLGPEFGEKLGVARTQELLAARRLDGGWQFFSRAIDFGFSKDYRETLRIWGHDAALADVVRVIREFQPDVIITRFSTKPGGTHGHHTSSAVLAEEAFKLAADPKAYPEQLTTLKPWQAKRIFWNVFNWGRPSPETEGMKIDVSGVDPVRGISIAELAGESRAQHKTQGFDQFQMPRAAGPHWETFRLLDGAPAEKDIFDGVDATWARFPGGAEIAASIDAIHRAFDAKHPAASVPALLELRGRVAALGDDPRVQDKLNGIETLLRACLQIEVQTTVPHAEVVSGETLPLHLQAASRGAAAARWMAVRYPSLQRETRIAQALSPGTSRSVVDRQSLPADTPLSQPYWLRAEPDTGLFRVEDAALIGRAENPPVLPVEYVFEVNGQTFVVKDEPVQESSADVKPALRERLTVIPSVSLHFETGVELFAPGASRKVAIVATAARPNLTGKMELNAPRGWSVKPTSISFKLAEPGQTARAEFSVTAPAQLGAASFGATARVDGKVYSTDRIDIHYAHIPPQVLQPAAHLKAVALQVTTMAKRVGYLPGAGDAIADALRQLGCEVTVLSGADLTAEKLHGLDAVVVGVRALNTRTDLAANWPALLAFVERGGNLVLQYNNPNGLKVEKFSPYEIHLSGDRVTDETAAMTLLAPQHPALTTPNKISAEDFEGWVQERGLYFPDRWDEHFTPLLACNDPGEATTQGALLVAPYGHGHIVYTGLAFFRQLPAGVPGAYRLFANLISLGK